MRGVRRFIEAEMLYALVRKPWTVGKLAKRLEGVDESVIDRVLKELVSFGEELVEKNAR